MTTVFIGGSRAVSRLNATIRERLDDLVDKGCQIFVGDANGADKAVQQYFADRDYRNVTVFCMGACRDNVGNWEVRRIKSDSSRKDFGVLRRQGHRHGPGSEVRRDVLGR